jgi:hypothetical protein
MAQYSFQIDEYLPGTEMGALRRNDSHIAGTLIYPGTPLKLDVDSGKVVSWGTVGYDDVPFYGIALRTSNMYNNYNSDADYYQVGEMVTVGLTNDTPILTSVDVKVGQKVYIVAATGAFTNVALNNGEPIGSFRRSAAANTFVKIHFDQL